MTTVRSPHPSDAAIGMQLAQCGRFADALPYLDRANRHAPANVALLHALASLLLWAGRGAEAIERYRSASAIAPGDTGILSGWARALWLLGEREQSLDLLDRTLAADPHFADPRGSLDALVRGIGDADAACRLLQGLIERHPAHTGLLRSCAIALRDSERPAQAQAALERLRDLQPQDPYAHVELGRLAVACGDSASASMHFQSALAVAPDYAAALWELAQISDWRLEPEAVIRMQNLAQAETDPKPLAGLHAILARHYDRAGDPGEASVHFAHTNALMAHIAAAHAGYDRQRHAIEIDATIRDFTPALIRRLAEVGSTDARPVFVIGLPRSGTTLLEQMLASHPSIVGVGETAIASASLRRALAASGRSPAMLGAHAIAAAAGWHIKALEDRLQRMPDRPVAARIVDKMPDNYLLAGWLRIAFPHAAIVHCLRDPRDVALSCWMTQFADVPWSFDLHDIADRIGQHRRLLNYWRTTLGANLTELRYERLIADPEAELRRILAAIGVDWNPGVLEFSARKGYVASASRQQVREALHARSVGRWRKYVRTLEPVLPMLDAIAADDASDSGASAIHDSRAMHPGDDRTSVA